MRLGAVAFFLFFPFAQTGSALGIQICLSLAAAVVLCAYPGGYSPSIGDYYLRQPHRIVLLAVPIALATLVGDTHTTVEPTRRGLVPPPPIFPGGDPLLLSLSRISIHNTSYFPCQSFSSTRHNVGPKTCP